MSATAMLGVAAAALTLGAIVASAAQVHDASARAAGAADAAALAAADAALGWVQSPPCALAAQVAESAGAELQGCELDTVRGQVRLSVSVQTIFGSVHARARAGPEVA